MEQGAGIGRAQWLEERRRGIGGTDVSGILGVSPWASPYDVWLQKVGRAPRSVTTGPMWWGLALEDIIARGYMEKTGRKVWNPKKFIVHERYPVLIGSPDRLVLGEGRGLEIKTASAHAAREWGEEWTDNIHPVYLLQCLHYLSITGFRCWDVATLIGGNDLRFFTVRRSTAVEERVTPRLLTWWAKHVEGNLPPPITGHKGTTSNLGRMYPNGNGVRLVADGRAERWAAMLSAARRKLKDAEAEVAEAENNLKAIMGQDEGMDGLNWKVSWKNSAGRSSVDYKTALFEVADKIGVDPALVAETIRAHTTVGEPPRVFRYSEKEGTE